MSTSRRKLIQNTVAVNIGCSCRRRTDLSTIFWPKPKSKLFTKSHPKSDLYNNSSSSSLEQASGASLDDSTITFSPTFDTTTTPQSSEAEDDSIFTTTATTRPPIKGFKRFDRIGGSVAVVKDSCDPYHDFRHSMLQMILEKEIYSREDLRKLLNCFLSLNSPYHHEIIVQAFTEIWNGVFSTDQKHWPLKHCVKGKPREFLM
ncbi:hypothetical protein Scep_003393 [Stephania cephalantha]|uniref:Transcription repressor n=1 Tax=Stephania cephalantha TaxID=152367 RepID=A0AAP0PWA5_9MAGN